MTGVTRYAQVCMQLKKLPKIGEIIVFAYNGKFKC